MRSIAPKHCKTSMAVPHVYRYTSISTTFSFPRIECWKRQRARRVPSKATTVDQSTCGCHPPQIQENSLISSQVEDYRRSRLSRTQVRARHGGTIQGNTLDCQSRGSDCQSCLSGPFSSLAGLSTAYLCSGRAYHPCFWSTRVRADIADTPTSRITRLESVRDLDSGRTSYPQSHACTLLFAHRRS